uniref:Putative LOC100905235 [Metaseiulus occidentalis] n=1 Tax=Lepeophtheirus salmonis TaxID=72036 RepID=A0A0K2TC55_LEPSM
MVQYGCVVILQRLFFLLEINNCILSLTLKSCLLVSMDAYERVHVDYAKINKNICLILMDTASKWIEAAIMNNTSTQSTLSHLIS